MIPLQYDAVNISPLKIQSTISFRHTFILFEILRVITPQTDYNFSPDISPIKLSVRSPKPKPEYTSAVFALL